MRDVNLPRITALGLSLELYRAAFPGYMERLGSQLERFCAPLRRYAAIRRQALCTTAEQVDTEISAAEEAADDALLLIPLSYTPSGMVAHRAAASPLPLVLWNTQEAETFDEDYNFEALRLNHVCQGTQDITSVLVRLRRPFGLESGHYRDAAAHARLGDWLCAARACCALRPLRTGLIGRPFEGMDDFFYAPETLRHLSYEPVTIRIATLVEYRQSVTEEEITAALNTDRQRYTLDPGLDETTLRESLGLELALRRLVEEERLDALTVNFQALSGRPDLPTLPFLGINKLMGEGLGYAGEGDLLRAAHMAQARLLAGSANFTEMFTVDYVRRRILMTHMQECNPAWARRDRPVRLVKKEFWAPGIAPYAGMVFTLEPGPVTLAALTEDPEGGRLVVYETGIADQPPLPRFDIPHWVLELEEPAEAFLTRYSMAGGPHHLVALPGHQATCLAKLARLQQLRLHNL